jgi:MoaA/NifB/PqqE/SkfB family radical SAM enzyme
MRKFPAALIRRYIANLARARFQKIPNQKLLPPMVATLYLTMKCNFRCTYCDDGSGNMYPSLPDTRLSTPDAISLLKILRRTSPALSLTGGEPTLHPDIHTILREADQLGFSPISLNTNAFSLTSHLSVLHHIDFLIVSLDSINNARGDRLIGLDRTGQTERVKTNIEHADRYRHASNLAVDIIVNTVVLPETIDDARQVFEYCLRKDFYWTPMPYIVGKYPAPGLVDNPRWVDLINEVISLKKRGAKVFGSLSALRTIRDFERFECYPTTHPVVYPNGDLCYPCSPLNLVAGNLLETGDYATTIRIGEQLHGSIPHCDSRCHVACHTESSLAISDPISAVRQAFRHFFSFRRGLANLKEVSESGTAHPIPTSIDVRSMPALPPDQIRRFRRDGLVVDDWTSRFRIPEAGELPKLVQLTRVSSEPNVF